MPRFLGLRDGDIVDCDDCAELCGTGVSGVMAGADDTVETRSLGLNRPGLLQQFLPRASGDLYPAVR